MRELVLPDVPIAATNTGALERLGALMRLRRRDVGSVLVLIPRDKFDENSVWVNPEYKGYRTAWDAAAGEGLVDQRSDIWRRGKGVDIDHVFPKSWASVPGWRMEWLRLYPVWSEINQHAGSLEAISIHGIQGKPPRKDRGIVYAGDMQIRKMLNHPRETPAVPGVLFHPVNI